VPRRSGLSNTYGISTRDASNVNGFTILSVRPSKRSSICWLRKRRIVMVVHLQHRHHSETHAGIEKEEEVGCEMKLLLSF